MQALFAFPARRVQYAQFADIAANAFCFGSERMSFDPRDPPDPYDERNPGFQGREGRPADPPPMRDPYEYRDPLDPYAGGGEGAKSAARSQVIGPAIFLIIVGVLNLFSAVGLIFFGIVMNSVPTDQLEQQMKQKN